MAIEGFPLDSEVLGLGEDGLPIYSNAYDSRSLRRVNRQFFKQGVFDGDMLEPSFSYAPGYADNSSPYVKVSVGSGSAMLDGCVATVDEGFDIGAINAPVPPDTKNLARNRIDRVVITLEKGGSEESVYFEQLQGETNTGSTMPPAPALTRNGTKYQICIAEFDCVSYLDSNGNARYVYEMTDTRLDDYLCGIASALIDVDTTQFYTQMNTMISELSTATENAVTLAEDALQGTIAGTLQGEIDSLDTRVTTLETSGTTVTPMSDDEVDRLLNGGDPDASSDDVLTQSGMSFMGKTWMAEVPDGVIDMMFPDYVGPVFEDARNRIGIRALSRFFVDLSDWAGDRFAELVHKHSAADITSGTLGIARGGSNLTASPSMLTNLGSTSAANVFQTSPRPGITGILGYSNGGTNANSLSAAKSNLGITKASLSTQVKDFTTGTVNLPAYYGGDLEATITASSGYVFAGICGIDRLGGNDNVLISKWSYYGGKVYLNVKNTSSSAVNGLKYTIQAAFIHVTNS